MLAQKMICLREEGYQRRNQGYVHVTLVLCLSLIFLIIGDIGRNRHSRRGRYAANHHLGPGSERKEYVAALRVIDSD